MCVFAQAGIAVVCLLSYLNVKWQETQKIPSLSGESTVGIRALKRKLRS